MRNYSLTILTWPALVAGFTALLAAPIAAQQAPAPAAPAGAPVVVCGTPVSPPANLPPAGSGPVLWLVAPCFESQGGISLVDVQTYLYYISAKDLVSKPSQNIWKPYDDSVEKVALEDFRRLWATKFLDNLWIETKDYTFANGTVGRILIYNLEERQRVKIVDYTGSKNIETSKIEDKLKEDDAVIRLDTFIDAGIVKKVEGIVRDMLKEKGFQFATVTHEVQSMPGSPKLVHLTFKMDEGPKVRIKEIRFIGNKAISSHALARQMKDNKSQWMFSWITGRGTYQEVKFDDDAEKIVAYYHDRGYINAHVGAPDVKFLEDSKDKKTRWISLGVPITEGRQYKVGDFTFAGNNVIKSDYLRPLFKMNTGDTYSEKVIRKGLEKSREVYGTGGYFEFTGYPDLRPRDATPPVEMEAPEALRAPEPKPLPQGPPIVDVVMRMQEGKQFFVNRITFVGNTTTRDNVIRRELRVVEGAPFNTEALKFSIKRLNQLGYFKPLEGGKDVSVDKTPNTDNKVDIKLKFEEQNRNSLTFGAGVSQFEGFFGQVSFQTSNFLGRGENLTLSLQAGSLAQNYTLAFTEPFLFDRNITGGFNIFKSEIRYIGQFTQQSTGAVVTSGFPLGGFTRFFMNYSYERVHVTEIADLYQDPVVLARNPFLRDSLLIGEGGERIISKVTPSIVHNTVDNPIFPTTGKRYTAALDLAGLGGNTNYWKPTLEGVLYWKQASRLTLGMRGQYQYIHAFSGSKDLPIFEKLFLGGEYTIRGFDIRTIGPQDPATGLVLGGNKSLLANFEEMISIAGPVRLILFYDAGEVQSGPELQGPPAFVADGGSIATTLKPGVNFNLKDVKTSTGAEIRFFMPVLNVPFRLIFAYDPQRNGVLDDNLQPQKGFSFRFAVGSTF